MTLFLLLLILLALFGYAVLTFNRLDTQIETIRNKNEQIDNQLDRRFKVYESIINIVKNYMDVDQTILREVIALHKIADAARKNADEKTRMDAENQISTIAPSLKIFFDQYPDLKSNPTAVQLQKEIFNIENNLAYSKETYNDSIEIYNVNKTSFPASIILSMFRNKLDFIFTYWQLKGQKTSIQEASYTVQL